MEDPGGERQVEQDTSGPVSPPALLDLLITRLAEPAAVLDDSLAIVATNDAFAALGAADGALVGEPLTAVVPALTDDVVEDSVDTPGEYVSVRTREAPDRVTEFGFDRHGSHVLCIGRPVSPTRSVGAAADSAGRWPPEDALADLQTATLDLLAARTGAGVAEHIVETATDVLGLPGATLYLFDGHRNALWPAAVAGTGDRDERAVVGGDGVVSEVFLDGGTVTVDGGDRYQSLGDHGVLYTVAGRDRGAGQEEGASTRRGPDERTRELLDRLAETGRAALDRVEREATLRERDAVHRERTERIAELERTQSLVRRVQRVLVDADSVTDIEQRVCAALTASSWLSFAWVGRAAEDTVEPRARAGRGSGYLEAVSLSLGDPDAAPAAQTAASNQVTAVDAVADDIRDAHWPRAAIAREFQAVISVPLRTDGVSHGTLTVYADRPVAWDDSLASVFTELAASIAMAVRYREQRTRLAADAGLELDLCVTAPETPLGRLATALGEPLCCTEAIPVDGSTTRLFVSAPGADHDAVTDAVAGVPRADSLVAVEGDRYELLVHEPGVVGRAVRHGGRLDTVSVTDGELALKVTLAVDADVRAFVDRLERSCEHVRLTARRHRPTATGPRGGIRDSLEAELTDRQLEALRTAYGSGFFEWPRETTGEGVAEMLGVAQPTVNRHLRVAQRKLLELVFDGE
ncbi:bacterio-opsin activator domain-containing protein [Haloarcula onubensis]|uniref:Helix-turn-helix domain-containing protein n=1 Tax=Haloarcula onubensis TaxID=2950539 RepID=A0ABU2FJS3_9EURY|nr:bacterio-opsin activator domain-containing protein [Halomicroarcula sp. S3CR25-11]MDS0281009.1 helix-turn-helix domain-containing protein [Halomicroarcula sp. S3CR25-11]